MSPATARRRLIWVESPTNPLLKLVDLHDATVGTVTGELGGIDNELI